MRQRYLEVHSRLRKEAFSSRGVRMKISMRVKICGMRTKQVNYREMLLVYCFCCR